MTASNVFLVIDSDAFMGHLQMFFLILSKFK